MTDAWAAAKRFIVAVSGPGTQTRDADVSPVNAATVANDDSHDSVVLITRRGAPEDPDVASATGTPAASAASRSSTVRTRR
ncbi:MAG: hypothetical protein ABI776_12230 [Nocardioidaceae bacterium]